MIEHLLEPIRKGRRNLSHLFVLTFDIRLIQADFPLNPTKHYYSCYSMK